MTNKYVCLLVVCVAAVALLPGFSLASRDRNHNNNYHGSDYDGRNYNYDNDWDYRGDYSSRGYQHRNAAAYPDYVPANNYYYAGYGYDYSRNYNYGCNCPIVYQANAGQYYYNSASGATNYTQISSVNYNCPASYYPAYNAGCQGYGCGNANYYSPNYY
ncbi:MAG: hypothetical protein L7H18_02825 [Candidatus Nealsonbacteria bacterium DGGOD1a]|jgi:hypothetical protein|nr:MAG: hypothetical protein L7H18_02825 [Candidatus Nealsonbacteria bacterium DGGOD1a]